MKSNTNKPNMDTLWLSIIITIIVLFIIAMISETCPVSSDSLIYMGSNEDYCYYYDPYADPTHLDENIVEIPR